MPHISQVHFKTSVAAEGSLPLMLNVKAS